MALLVTGGAGYIGSHTVYQLRSNSEPVVVLDNLSTGFRWAIPEGIELIEGDFGDEAFVEGVIKQYGVTEVIHFAAKVVVEESLVDPTGYFENNVAKLIPFLRVCRRQGVKRFIFSSTAAVYGNAQQGVVDERARLEPANPYGASKLAAEYLVRSSAEEQTYGQKPMSYLIFRYFNVAGSQVEGKIGQSTKGATHLIKVAAEAATGQRPKVQIYGTDYETQDGTCRRDFIHVDDLAQIHLKGLEYLRGGGRSERLNCGYGRSSSVRDVITTMKKVSGVDFKVEEVERRPGDPIDLIADPSQMKRLFSWEPQFESLDLICKTSFDWEKNKLKEFS